MPLLKPSRKCRQKWPQYHEKSHCAVNPHVKLPTAQNEAARFVRFISFVIFVFHPKQTAMKKTILLMLCLFAALLQTANAQKQRIIFETDMGNDIDDALALDVICKYMDDGKIDFLGVSTHKEGANICPFVDAMLTWYGYPKVPIAKSATPVSRPQDGNRYADVVVEQTDDKGKPLYKRSKKEKDFINSTEFYRKTLSRQPDNSVVIVSVGFGTNLAALLNSKPDKYSKLTGRELVAKKVKLLSIMMGNNQNPDHAEYNVACDIKTMQETIDKWPGEIMQNPFEVGEKVVYPSGIFNERLSWTENHPLVKAYNTHNPNPHDQCTWDILSIIYLIQPDMFGTSPRGTITVNDNGTTRFTPSATGKHRYLITTPEQNKALQQLIIDTTARKPKNFKE